MAYSMDSTTDGCYPGTTCLINKLGIRDEVALAETEAAVVLGKASLLDQQPIAGGFDFDHYKRIHQFLFCDLYDWAGQIRTINISKKGTTFVPAIEIEPCADVCFKRLAGFSGERLSHRELAEEVADFYHTVNMLHPFREGNGRAQRVFFTQWIRSLGYDLDLSSVDPDAFMIATIYAAQGVMDQLVDFFEQTIEWPQIGMRMT
ncbi:cell filamentation protein Fic [Colidextribacter sp. OB.20]|uniref:Fic/DOC family protein n=1 Tax=Colidextribacter sp. OB.20 TaxID=2304568 RepID=UPI00136A9143|nr:Fic family protein [Colidextribacter sp. OB.20]NBI11556.1 cell filamentation protein Fic [Colidextribacter sp. OB.20]